MYYGLEISALFIKNGGVVYVRKEQFICKRAFEKANAKRKGRSAFANGCGLSRLQAHG
jgi:hypothetical protein